MQTDFANALCTPIETPRLRLEPLKGAHADAAFGPLQDDRVYTWISMNKPSSVDTLRANWKRVESRQSPDGKQAWPSWLVVSRHTGEAMGEVDAAIDSSRVCVNFGYFFFPAYWGNGFATEAVTAATDHLLWHGIARLVATVTAGNIASARVLQKAGFAFTRVIPGNDTVRGVLVDDEEYVRAV